MAIPINDFTYITQKIRNVTARPSPNQLSDEAIRGYINSFMVYDLPLHNRFFYQKEKFSMILTPDQGVYPITAFKNLYSNFEPPAYVDGFQIQYYQDDQSFFQMFSQLKYMAQFATGNGTGGFYGGFYSYRPIQPTTAVISTINAAGVALSAVDTPISSTQGVFTGDAVGNINYITGNITGITWSGNIPNGVPIYISANQYVRGRPIAMLYFHDSFYFWPWPNRSYTFTIDTFKNPADFLLGGGANFPELKQWADTIAYGASMKILSDNLDMENYQKVAVLFDGAKRLALRRTMTQLATQRVATIYGDAEQFPWQNGYPYN